MLEISTKTSRKIILIAILSTLLVAAFALTFEFHYRQVTTAAQEEEMKRIMSFALNSIAPVRKEFRNGRLSAAEAEKEISNRLGYFTLDSNGSTSYMFMGNLDGKHPIRQISSSSSEIPAPEEDFAATGRGGSGFLTYNEKLPQTGRIITKSVYITGLQELNLYIGIGNYTSVFLKISAEKKPRLIALFFLFIVALTVMIYIILIPVLNSVRYITGKIYSIDAGAEIEGLFSDRPVFRNNSDEEILVRKFEEIITSIYRKSDITINALKEKNRDIEHNLTEKEIMLKEINHRVKNNLQVIISLLRIQLTQHQDPAIREPFLETISRLESISMIHNMLYRSNNYTRIGAGKYLGDLTSFIIAGFGAGGRVKIKLNIDETELSVEQAVSIGIIVNEAVTNSIKYAFIDSGGIIEVSLLTSGDYRTFSISDNGCGLPDEMFEGSSAGLGINLIRNLSRQLKGELEINNIGGTSYRISFR